MQGQFLSLEQRQKLVLSPQLRQALSVLQLPLAGLAQLVQQELCENPVLEVREEPVWHEEEAAPEEPDWLEFFGDSSDLGLVRGEPVRDEPRAGEPAAGVAGGLVGGL
ncbi:MAG: hypothetical protein AB1816_19225, partial [Bacillota bacterium]